MVEWHTLTLSAYYWIQKIQPVNKSRISNPQSFFCRPDLIWNNLENRLVTHEKFCYCRQIARQHWSRGQPVSVWACSGATQFSLSYRTVTNGSFRLRMNVWVCTVQVKLWNPLRTRAIYDTWALQHDDSLRSIVILVDGNWNGNTRKTEKYWIRQRWR